jgi:hypothetical protein
MKKLITILALLCVMVISQNSSSQDYIALENLQSIKLKLKDNNHILRNMNNKVIGEKKKELGRYYDKELEKIIESERNMEKINASLSHELSELKFKKIMKGKHKQPFFDKKIKRFKNIKHKIEIELTSIISYEKMSGGLLLL